MSGGIKLQWRDRNYAEESHRIYRSDTPMSLSSMPTPIATLTNNVTEYIDYDVIEGNTYYYRIGAVRGADEAISDEVELVAEEIINGPGPETLIAGDMTAGFFGEIQSSEFITGDLLASSIGLTAGTPKNNNTAWLKFSYNDKILFIPKLNIRNDISWRNIYDVGALYGTDDNGIFPTTTPRIQDARVTIGNDVYKVRLIKGQDADPATSIGREWLSLFYPIHITDVSNKTWGVNYSSSDIGIEGRILLQERLASSTGFVRLIDGSKGINYTGQLGSIDQGSGYVTRWRPVLEWIP